MHRNISSYARQGIGPIETTAHGENFVAVAFIRDDNFAQCGASGGCKRLLERCDGENAAQTQ